MTAEREQLTRERKPMSPACDRCTLGVMDSGNPHLWGDCRCSCHPENGAMTAAYIDDGGVRRFRPDSCEWCEWEGEWLELHMFEVHPPCACGHVSNEHMVDIGCVNGWEDEDEWGEPAGCLCDGFHEPDGGDL